MPAPRPKGTIAVQADGMTPAALGITPARLSRYLQAMAGGNYRTTAAAYAGVSVTTVHRWDNYGERVRTEWDAEHRKKHLAPILAQWLTEHPAAGSALYSEDSPAFNDPPPVPIAPGYWLCVVMTALLPRAEAEAEVTAIARIQRAAAHPQHWQAAVQFLERRHPERWGRTDRVQVSGGEGEPIRVQHVPPEELVALLGRLKAQRELTERKGAAAPTEPNGER